MKKINKSLLMIIGGIVLIFIVTISIFLNKENKKTNFLNNINNVSYIVLEYDGESKDLDNEFIKIISKLDNGSIAEESSISISENDTGEQPYIIILYDKNNEELYRISYTYNIKIIKIFNETGSYYIEDNTTSEYLENIINKEI